MKRILAIATALLVCASSAFAAVTITTYSKTFSKDGGAASVSTGGSGTWTATTDASWITFNRASGNAGVSCVYVVSANFSADTRSAVIDIGGNAYTVTQTGYTATLSPASAALNFAGGSGTVTIAVDAGVSWSARANADWLSVEPASGMSAGTVAFTVSPNESTTTRTGSITIAGQTFTVTQTGIDVVLSTYRIQCDYQVGVFEVIVEALSSTSWTVSPNNSWISVVDDGYGRGNSTIMVAVGQNPSVATRTGTVSIGSRTLSIVQGGMNSPALAITPTEATASPAGAFGNVAVYSTPDSPWVAESKSDWITLSDGTTGAGNGNTKYVATANPLLEPRTGRVMFRQVKLEPDDDLDAGHLISFDTSSSSDTATRSRTASHSLSSTFDGTFAITFSGEAIPKLSRPDWSVGLEFRLGQLDSLNRLLELFSFHSIYVNAENRLCVDGTVSSFVIDSANTAYRLILCQEDDGHIRLYAGKRGAEAVEAASFNSALMRDLTASETPIASAFKLGQTSRPSSGYLRSGQTSAFDFWCRALTETEANRFVAALPFSKESEPSAIPAGATCTHFRCSENGWLSVANGLRKTTDKGISVSGWSEADGRHGQRQRAMTSSGGGKIVIDDVNTIFPGTYVLNDGKPLDNSREYYTGGWKYKNAWYKTENSSGSWMFLHPFPVSSTGPFSATYSFWIRVNSLSGKKQTLFCRVRESGQETDCSGRSVNEWFKNNRTLSLSMTEDGKLLLSQNGAESTMDGDCIQVSEWAMITLVGVDNQSITVYINGLETGSVSSSMSFAYFPPTDARQHAYYVSASENDRGIEGSVVPTVQSFTIGGWNGALDEVSFFDKALTSAQVRALYEATKPLEATHTVTQGVIDPVVTPTAVSFEAAGGSTNVTISVPSITQWTATSGANWITVTSSASSAGSARVSFDVSANPSTEARSGTLTLAGKTVTVSQSGLWSQLSYDGTVFTETSDSGWIDVQVEGNGAWTATSDASWLTLLDTEGAGSGSVMFVVDDFNTTVASRTATVTIAGKTLTITQRGYELSIDPAVAEIGSNAGAGEIGITAPIDAVWEAIVTADWITLQGGSTGMGSGTLRYTVADNLTGGTRTGKIIISGQEYTVTQRPYLTLEAVVDGQGTVAGTGHFETNDSATLAASPAAGYVFSHWSGDAVGVEPTVSLTMDSSKTVTAHFIPEGAAQRLAEEKAAQGGFYTRDQIHSMELGNLLIDVDSSTGKARIGVQLQETSDLANPDWKPVTVTVQDLDIGSDGSVGIKAPATGNTKFFRVISGGDHD